MPTPRLRLTLRRVLIAAAAAIVVIVAVVAAVLLHSPGNVSHPGLSFTAPTTSSTPTTPSHATKPKATPTFYWPRYGYDSGRTRSFPAPATLVPPFRVGWRLDDHALLEFPPVIYGNVLYDLDDDGSAKAIDKRTGHVIWQRKVGTLAAASPALFNAGRLVIMPTLSDIGHHPGDGQIVALSMRTGRIAWSHPVPAGSESSPIVYGSTVYLGDGGGTVYSMNARTGKVNWTYHASAAVKGGPALSGGILYFGDYAGRAYALRALSGRQVWAVSTDGAHFGFGSGNFYSTPAVAFGRVYLGNTDGFVYSFAARTGQVAWRTSTGAYVYASPAVADVADLGPTVYLGSYNGQFYAFNAQSGQVRWSHPAGGRISGAATIVGDVVYYSDLGTKSTTGLNTRTGRVVFSFGDGAFNPVIADDSTIYLDGYGEIYQLLPASHHVTAAPHTAPAAHRAPAKRHIATKPRHVAKRRHAAKPVRHRSRRHTGTVAHTRHHTRTRKRR